MTKNENGVYLDHQDETVASVGRSHATVSIARCDDGLYRHALNVRYSYGGFMGPITDHDEGYATYAEAKTAGMVKLLRQLPKAHASEPHSVQEELRELRKQIERHLQQPSLF